MKRKSIFLTIVAVFLASVAWGQNTWPPKNTLPNGAKGSDTIYFCATYDSLYPIELGVDVAGKKLSPEYGEWTLYSTTKNVWIDDYSFGATKNGGAGNAFKVVGSGVGGYIFQYKAKNKLCGLEEAETFLVYVFVLPDFTNTVTVDSTTCLVEPKYDPRSLRPDINTADYFKKYLGLYDTANITYTWKYGSFADVPVDSVGVYGYTDTLRIASAPKGYTCGGKGAFKYTLKVVKEVGQLPYKARGICDTDTLGNGPDVNPNYWFERTFPGTYTPNKVGSTKGTVDGTWVEYTPGKWRCVYKFTYRDCGASTDSYAYDTLYIETAYGNWGADTVTFCRTVGDMTVFQLYDSATYPKIPQAPWKLSETNSQWLDWGTSGRGVIPVTYGTIHGYTSLKDKTVLIDSLRSNIRYTYQWFASGIECAFSGTPEKPDSGLIVVVIQDPFIAQDYTAQLCRTSYTSGFNVSEYTGVPVQWYDDGNNSVLNNTLNIAGFSPATLTYKYHYNIAPGCGPGGTGVFYLKVTDKVKVASSKTVKYCKDRLPSRINLNDVLNVAIGTLEWEYYGDNASNTSPIAVAAGFDKKGILTIADFTKTFPSATKFVFKVSNGGSCGVNANTTLIIEFGDVL
jgi:hypothetical protein